MNSVENIPHKVVSVVGVMLVFLGLVMIVSGLGLVLYNTSDGGGEVVINSGGEVVVVDEGAERVVSLSEVGGSDVRGEYVEFESLSESEQELLIDGKETGEVVIDGDDEFSVDENMFSVHIDGELVVFTVGVSDIMGDTNSGGQPLFIMLFGMMVFFPLGFVILVFQSDL